MKIANSKEVKSLKKATDKVVAEETTSKSAKIKALFELGLDVKEISVLLNIRYNFAYNVISNYVITNKIEVTNELKVTKKAIVKELLLDKRTAKEIATITQTNLNYIYKIIKTIKQEEVLPTTTDEVINE